MLHVPSGPDDVRVDARSSEENPTGTPEAVAEQAVNQLTGDSHAKVDAVRVSPFTMNHIQPRPQLPLFSPVSGTLIGGPGGVSAGAEVGIW